MKTFIRSAFVGFVPMLTLAFLSLDVSEARAQVRLERGDVILSVNGQSVSNASEFTRLVNSSAAIMHFTVQDVRSGNVLDLQTRLNSRGYRFGAYVANNGGHGVRITGLMKNAAASRCYGSTGISAAPSPRTPSRDTGNYEMNQINRQIRRGVYSGTYRNRDGSTGVFNATPRGY